MSRLARVKYRNWPEPGREPGVENILVLTGIVRDKLGRKMSKTLGNSPDPLDLIAKYGADAVRIGMLLCASAGNDIFYDESQVEQGRNFCGKIWNSYRLVKGWTVDSSIAQPEACAIAVDWFRSKLNSTVETVEDHYSKFRISDALMSIYKLFWDDYCSWYLELVKPAYGQAIDKATLDATLGMDGVGNDETSGAECGVATGDGRGLRQGAFQRRPLRKRAPYAAVSPRGMKHSA